MQSLRQALRAGGELVVTDFKREPGRSSDWILEHLHAGQATVTAKSEAAGFKQVEECDFLRDNSMLAFRKVTP
jgi:predicted methyltransferase